METQKQWNLQLKIRDNDSYGKVSQEALTKTAHQTPAVQAKVKQSILTLQLYE